MIDEEAQPNHADANTLHGEGRWVCSPKRGGGLEHKTLFYHSGGSISPAMPSMAKLAPPSASYVYGHGAPPPHQNQISCFEAAGWSGLASLGGLWRRGAFNRRRCCDPRCRCAHFVFPRFPCCALAFRGRPPCFHAARGLAAHADRRAVGAERAKVLGDSVAVLDHERLDERGPRSPPRRPCASTGRRTRRGGALNLREAQAVLTRSICSSTGAASSDTRASFSRAARGHPVAVLVEDHELGAHVRRSRCGCRPSSSSCPGARRRRAIPTRPRRAQRVVEDRSPALRPRVLLLEVRVLLL